MAEGELAQPLDLHLTAPPLHCSWPFVFPALFVHSIIELLNSHHFSFGMAFVVEAYVITFTSSIILPVEVTVLSSEHGYLFPKLFVTLTWTL